MEVAATGSTTATLATWGYEQPAAYAVGIGANIGTNIGTNIIAGKAAGWGRTGYIVDRG